MKRQPIIYKDVKVMPNSELYELLESSKAEDKRKAEILYNKITKDGYQRGEFIKQTPIK